MKALRPCWFSSLAEPEMRSVGVGAACERLEAIAREVLK